MKIYQIHESWGMYDDYTDWIVGSYLNKKKAIVKMEEFKRINKEKRAQCDRCLECPLWEVDNDSDGLNSVIKKCSKHCSKAKIIKDPYGYDCDNYQGCYEERDYIIEEVEVEE